MVTADALRIGFGVDMSGLEHVENGAFGHVVTVGPMEVVVVTAEAFGDALVLIQAVVDAMLVMESSMRMIGGADGIVDGDAVTVGVEPAVTVIIVVHTVRGVRETVFGMTIINIGGSLETVNFSEEGV